DAAGVFAGDFAKMNSRMTALTRYVRMFDTDVAKRLGITIDELLLKSNIEWWLIGGEEMVKAKVVDQVVNVTIIPVTIPVIGDPMQLFQQYLRRRSDTFM